MPPQRWTDFSANPNSAEARDFRRRTLAAAWREPVTDRIDYLCSLASGKKVLDVGVADHGPDQRPDEPWLHGELAKSSASCLGVDVLPEALERLRSRGFNVMLRDISAEPFDQRFDLIVCGEVIEHVGNPAGLFAAAAKMLATGGRLAITTPNPYYLRAIRDALRGRFAQSVDHVTLISPSGAAEFAERAGLKLDAYRGVLGRRWQKWPARMRMGMVRRRRGASAIDRFCRSLIFEFVKFG